MAAKRRHFEESEWAVSEAREVRDELDALYGDLPEDFLWDTGKVQTLRLPTNAYSEECRKEYSYIGRAKAKELLQAILKLSPGNVLLVQGAKGSGKTTAISSIVGYLLGAKRLRVVYICSARFISAPADALRHALLVATRCEEHLADFTHVEDLVNWCSSQWKKPLLFVVDDWDRFERFPDQELLLKSAVSHRHVLVKLSSTNSRERQISSTSDKAPPTFDFDGPYKDDELQTWIAQSSLPTDKLEVLDYFTGGMPRLLYVYEEVEGDQQVFQDKIEQTYTLKLHYKLVALHTTKEELAAVLRLVTTGVRSEHLKNPLDLTCFYKSRNKLVLLSPYLRTKAEYYILTQQKQLQTSLLYDDIRNWMQAVKMDCGPRGRNSPRVGWNVEGLVIAVMRYQGKLWTGLEFEHYRTYEHGCEATLLAALDTKELSEGVLVGPAAFNEKALDVIYIKLEKATGILVLKPVQITVSIWKDRKKKKSHIVWQEEVLPQWLAENWIVVHQFAYVLPDTVAREELEALDGEISASPSSSTSGSSVSLLGIGTVGNVSRQEVLFKRFGDVHEDLSVLDKLLVLEDVKLEKPPLLQCSGQVMENGTPRQCRRASRLPNATVALHTVHVRL